MPEHASPPSALSGYRVVDLADERGEFCAWIMGALGAEVIKIEAPAAAQQAGRGPFVNGVPGVENGLARLAYNTNKRSLTLSLQSDAGRAVLHELLADADFLIESFDPGYMAELGLDYDTLAVRYPRLIYVSISHFGQRGPYADYKGADLIHWALSSVMFVSGDTDRPPLRTSVPQAYSMAGSHAATGALLALAARRTTGEGQHVDQSIQQSMLIAAHNHAQFFEQNGHIVRRVGERAMSVAGLKSIIECKDGWVCIGYLFVPGRSSMHSLAQWMIAHNHGYVIHGVDWNALTPATASELPATLIEQVNLEITEFCRTLTKSELNQGAVDRQIFLYAASTTQDLYEMEQLEARGYFVPIEHRDGSINRYPGAFAVMSETPITLRHRAPAVGEHSDQILSELGKSSAEIRSLRETGAV